MMTIPVHHTVHIPYHRNSINNLYPLIKPKLFILLISMASSVFLLYFFLFFCISSTPSLSSNHRRFVSPGGRKVDPSVHDPKIRQACSATRYPDVCESMLGQPGRIPPDPKPVDVIQSALSISVENLKTGEEMVQDILESSTQNPNRSSAANVCLQVLQNAAFRSAAAADALSRGKVKDARAWASAALCYQYDCWSALKYVNGSSKVNNTMSYFDTTLIVSTSNALSMMRAFDLLGPDPSSWGPPKTERDGFWEPVSSGSGEAIFGPITGMEADATVCKGGGGGCYGTVQEAVDAAAENLKGEKRFVIRIKEGIYDEIVRVPLSKSNLVFLGDGKGKTVITGSLSTGLQGVTTYNTATVGVLGDGFMASGITFENTAGPEAHQAVAFRSDSDLSYVENCEFLGNQDTIYVHSLRQLYNNCHIEGNVDFIFGNAAAVFLDCTILVRPRQLRPDKGETNAVSAHGRTDPAQTTGFSFIRCLVNGTEEYMRLYRNKPAKHKNYLGRPWKMFSRTVYINCTLEALISPYGWLPWSGGFALSTLYYGEYGNSGPGADLSERVSWSSRIPAERISTYYVQNFLQGDEWISSAS